MFLPMILMEWKLRQVVLCAASGPEMVSVRAMVCCHSLSARKGLGFSDHWLSGQGYCPSHLISCIHCGTPYILFSFGLSLLSPPLLSYSLRTRTLKETDWATANPPGDKVQAPCLCSVLLRTSSWKASTESQVVLY